MGKKKSYLLPTIDHLFSVIDHLFCYQFNTLSNVTLSVFRFPTEVNGELSKADSMISSFVVLFLISGTNTIKY